MRPDCPMSLSNVAARIFAYSSLAKFPYWLP